MILPIINKKNDYSNIVHTPFKYLCANGVFPTTATVNTNAPLTRLFGNEFVNPHQKALFHRGSLDITPMYTAITTRDIAHRLNKRRAAMRGRQRRRTAGDTGV
jgi:hypothetical protein